MSMFKKPKRNFRGRRNDSDSDEERRAQKAHDNSNGSKTADSSVILTAYVPACKSEPIYIDLDPEPIVSTRAPTFTLPPSVKQSVPITSIKPAVKTEAKSMINTTKDKKDGSISKVPSTNSILSFINDEEETEEFKIKKSSRSKQIVKQLKKESLKEKVVSVPPAQFSSRKQEPPVKQEVHNGKRAPTKLGVPVVSSASEEESGDDSDDDVDKKNRSAASSVHDILKSGQIPDANLIHMARKRRQMAREMGEDCIPLDDTIRSDKKSSRLVREDDNDRSDDDDDERLAFSVDQKDAERRKIQNSILAAAEESNSEDSDQERQWEEQQIRKGVSIPAQVPASTAAEDYFSTYQQLVYNQQAAAAATGSYQMPYVGTTGGYDTVATPVMPPSTSSQSPPTVESVRKLLSDRLTEMCSVHRVHAHERDDLASRLDTCQSAIDKYTGQTGSLEEQYRFFQETRGYVRDLVECMNEKMSSIEFLERCWMQLLKQRADRMVKRRQEDVKDQSLEYAPGKQPPLPGAVTTAEETEKKRRRAEREGRRARRRRAREGRGVRDHNDGMSTDDEENFSEMSKLKTERERLTNDAATAFDDVIDDFCKYPLIASRFERWKREYGGSYSEAYIGQCLPKLFTPLVRLDLVMWNPLEVNCADFEDSVWYTSLSMYACSATDDAELTSLADDSDIKLVPNIIDKVLVPKLTGLVESIWDPLSMQQTKRLAALVRRLISDYPTVCADSKTTQALIKSIVQRIKKTLDDDIFMPMYPKHVLENRTSDATVFFHRQLWTCIKLLASINQFNGILSERTVQELGVDCLLNRYIVLALHNSLVGPDTIAKCQAITASFSRDWFVNLKSDCTLPRLENFCRYLVNTAMSLSKDPVNRETIRQIIKILVGINATNHAVALADRCSFKVAD